MQLVLSGDVEAEAVEHEGVSAESARRLFESFDQDVSGPEWTPANGIIPEATLSALTSLSEQQLAAFLDSGKLKRGTHTLRRVSVESIDAWAFEQGPFGLDVVFERTDLDSYDAFLRAYLEGRIRPVKPSFRGDRGLEVSLAELEAYDGTVRHSPPVDLQGGLRARALKRGIVRVGVVEVVVVPASGSQPFTTDAFGRARKALETFPTTYFDMGRTNRSAEIVLEREDFGLWLESMDAGTLEKLVELSDLEVSSTRLSARRQAVAEYVGLDWGATMFSVSELAELTGYNPESVRRAIREERLQADKREGSYVITKAAAEAWWSDNGRGTLF
jgi:hypothetical protein